MTLNVWHLEDEIFEVEKLQKSLRSAPVPENFTITAHLKCEDFFQAIKAKPPVDIFVLDIDLKSEGNAQYGVQAAKLCRDAYPHTAIIMCSGYDDAATIKACLDNGADDFISKRSDKGELALRIYNSYQLAKYKRGVGAEPVLRTQALSRKSVAAVAGSTLEKISNRIPRILQSAITAVHISGESGTGKEVTADLFQQALPEGTPFLKMNCGAVTPSLLESELFGRVKGAFTGATHDKRGLIEAASGGWIFLDEVATLSATAQVALLRALENQEIIRVGDNQPRKVNVKFLSASNENLQQLVTEGKFRQDLWQRLCETEIKLPPLRERVDEIEPLIMHFCQTMPGGPYKITAPAVEILTSVGWSQGNVRELRNTLRAMTEYHVEKLLTPIAIPDRLFDELGEKKDVSGKDGAAKTSSLEAQRIVLQWGEKGNVSYDFLCDLLLLELTKQFCKLGKVSMRSLARIMGISRSTLSTRLKSLVQKNIIELKELVNLVNINEK